MSHQPRYEVYVAALAVELGHGNGAALPASGGECCGELRTAVERVRAIPRLDLHELADDLEALRLREPRERRALCFDA